VCVRRLFSWVTELQEGSLCQEIFQFFPFKQQAATFYITDIMRFGQVSTEFQLCYFVFLFFKEDFKRVKFHCLPFFFNPSIAEQKKYLLLCNWVHFVPIFLKLLSQQFFQGSINWPNCSQNVAFIQISHFSWNYIE
jgi:hypothetical protein